MSRVVGLTEQRWIMSGADKSQVKTDVIENEVVDDAAVADYL